MDPSTAAVITVVRSTPVIGDDIRERVNALASEPTVDAMAAAAGAEARAVIMGLAADVADGTVVATPAVTAFFTVVPDVTAVDWTVVGEAVLLDVVTGVNTGE